MIYNGMLRVKNEARWIERVLRSLFPLCSDIHVLDDHSTDATVEICQWAGDRVKIHRSPFQGLNEVRDKDYLLKKIVESGPCDWIVHVDGDEELEAEGPAKIRQLTSKIQGLPVQALATRVMYLWDREDQVRVDGVYGRFSRPSVFRCPAKPIGFASHEQNVAGFHCTNVPASLLPGFLPTDIVLWHYGYIDRDMRIRKWKWYNSIDPNNAFEDSYRHIVAGDVPEVPAHIPTWHAGPLTLSARVG